MGSERKAPRGNEGMNRGIGPFPNPRMKKGEKKLHERHRPSTKVRTVWHEERLSMRFKAVLSDRGVSLLERGFVPSLEKFGKTCCLLLREDDVHFVQNVTCTDGPHVTAKLDRQVLFQTNKYRVESKHDNQIAFEIDLHHLLRVLRSAGAVGAESLSVKLTTKRTEDDPEPKPFLGFVTQGGDVQIEHDMPIGYPMENEDVDQVLREATVAQVCPYYLDLHWDLPRIQQVVERFKNISDETRMGTTKQGDLHLQVEKTSIQMGVEYRHLKVAPPCEEPPSLIASNAAERLDEATVAGDGNSVTVQIKNLNKTLRCPMEMQERVLCGIAENRGYVHFLFVFAHDGSRDHMHLSIKLPVAEDD